MGWALAHVRMHTSVTNPSPPFPLCPAAGQRGRGGEGLAEAQLPHILQDGVSPFAPGIKENLPAYWRGSLHEPSQRGPAQREQPISERDTSITMRTATENARHIQRTLPLKGRLTRGGRRPAPGQVGSAGRERGRVTIWTYSPPKNVYFPTHLLSTKTKHHVLRITQASRYRPLTNGLHHCRSDSPLVRCTHRAITFIHRASPNLEGSWLQPPEGSRLPGNHRCWDASA